MPVHVGIFYQVITYILLVVPAIQPLLNFIIFQPFLNTFVIFNLHSIEHRPLTVQKSCLTVQNAGSQIVFLQQITNGVRHIIIRPPGNYPNPGHRYRVAIPILRTRIKELAHALAPVHIDSVLTGSRIDKAKVTYFLSYLIHNYVLI